MTNFQLPPPYKSPYPQLPLFICFLKRKKPYVDRKIKIKVPNLEIWKIVVSREKSRSSLGKFFDVNVTTSPLAIGLIFRQNLPHDETKGSQCKEKKY